MPGRLRQATSRTSDATQDEGAYNIPGLAFNQALSWRAGKSLSIDDLFIRLKALHQELVRIEQGFDGKAIAKLASDLVHSNLLGHKDKGIRAWALQCVLEVLRVCAPNAPFNTTQLKDIFTVLVHTIIPALADPSNAYNTEHSNIIHNLIDTESIVLMTDLPDGEKLLVQLFTVCFDVVSGAFKNNSGLEITKSLELQLRGLLAIVANDAPLPQDVVDVVLSQFLRVDPKSTEASEGKKGVQNKDKTQSKLISTAYPPAYILAQGLCSAATDNMSASISQYFNTLITNAGAALDADDRIGTSYKRHDSVDSGDDEDADEALRDLRKIHRLVRELWRACPDVLLNVMPQLEVELAADSIALRQLAVETLGDMIAGIGIVGLPDLPRLDPTAYPLPTINDEASVELSPNPLLNPLSVKPFTQIYPAIYEAFLGRRMDKAVAVRTAWASAVGHILLTKAGGIGWNPDLQKELLHHYTLMLRDVDDRVRYTAIAGVEIFPYSRVVEVLASDGGLAETTSFMSNLADRVTDKRQNVRDVAMQMLGKIWGVASRDLADGVPKVCSTIGPAASRILNAMYTNDPHVTEALERALYESLFPWTFPPTKGNARNQDLGGDMDTVRARRLIVLVQGLDARAKPVFFAIQNRQSELSKAVAAFLQACEDYNGGVLDDPAEEKKVQEQLKRFIDTLSRLTPDPSRFAAELWKFAKAHDRRNYQLIRFAMGAEHDFRTATKAIKELLKRLRDGGTGLSSSTEAITSLLYRCALLCYNRSHVPGIMDISRSSDSVLAEPAQEVLRELAARKPEVLQSHVQALCAELQQHTPSDKVEESPTAADSLKACATFAKRYPGEVPKDRKFITAMSNFALYSRSSQAAKHAVSIVLIVSDKKELHAKELLTKALKRYQTNPPNANAQLATIAQVYLLAPHAAHADEPQILKILMQNVLQKGSASRSEYDKTAWSDDIDEETLSKQLALKILVNRYRSSDDKHDRKSSDKLAESVLSVLMKVIENEGELATDGHSPSTQRNRQRFDAARFVLKLCRHKRHCEELVTPTMFETIAHIMLNPPYGVRRGLVSQLKKHLGQNRINPRWYTILFLAAFEPDTNLRSSSLAFLRSRSAHFARQQMTSRAGEPKPQSANVMELSLARFLSLLSHHPDYPEKGSAEFDGDLFDFAKYIIFYLQAVATEENLSLVFHVAQRVKQARDAFASDDDDANERLYVLSDLAQATIRNYAEQMPASVKGNNLLQTWPGKIHLPTALFTTLPGHTEAQKIADTNYLPEEVALGLEHLVRKSLKVGKQSQSKSKNAPAPADRKRKSSMSMGVDEDGTTSPVSAKKAKTSSTLPIRKTPKTSKRKERPTSTEQPSRKSGRMSSAKVNYEESEEEAAGDEADQAPYHRSSPSTARKIAKRGSVRSAEGVDGADEEEEHDTTASSSPAVTPRRVSRGVPKHNQGNGTPGDKANIDVDMNEGGDDDSADEATGVDANDTGKKSTPLKKGLNGRPSRRQQQSDKSTPPSNKAASKSKKAELEGGRSEATAESKATTKSSGDEGTKRRSSRRTKA